MNLSIEQISILLIIGLAILHYLLRYKVKKLEQRIEELEGAKPK